MCKTMKEAFTRERVKTTASWEHVDGIVRDGEGNVIESNLVCKHVNIEYPDLPPIPALPTCADHGCIKEYKKEWDNWLNQYKRELDFFELLHAYNHARMEYVYRHRHDDIDMKYRTGDPMPTEVGEIMYEIVKLKLK